jgi:hypothetical protein
MGYRCPVVTMTPLFQLEPVLMVVPALDQYV